MQPLLLGQGPALKVRIGCIVRYTPEGHVCYLSSAFKLHRYCLSSPAEMPVPRVILKRKSCLSKNEPSDCRRLSLPSGSTRKCTMRP